MTVRIIAFGSDKPGSADEFLAYKLIKPAILANNTQQKLLLHSLSNADSLVRLIAREAQDEETLAIVAATPESAVELSRTLKDQRVQRVISQRRLAVELAAPPMEFKLSQSHSRAITTNPDHLNSVPVSNLKGIATLLRASYSPKPRPLDPSYWRELTSPQSVFIPGFKNVGKVQGYKEYDRLSDFLPFVDKMISLANNGEPVAPRADRLIESPLPSTLAAV